MKVQSSRDLRISLPILAILYPSFVVAWAISIKSLVALVLLFPVIFIVLAWIAFGRTLIFTKDGCTVRFIFFSKTYAWQDLKTKQIMDFSDRISNKEKPFTKGAVFYSKKVMLPKHLKPGMFNLYFNPFSFFFVYFRPDEDYYAHKSMMYSDLYVTDETEFRDNLKKWGIEINEETMKT